MTTINGDTRKRYVYRMQESPVGRLTLVASDDGLAAIRVAHDRAVAGERAHGEGVDDEEGHAGPIIPLHSPECRCRTFCWRRRES